MIQLWRIRLECAKRINNQRGIITNAKIKNSKTFQIENMNFKINDTLKYLANISSINGLDPPNLIQLEIREECNGTIY